MVIYVYYDEWSFSWFHAFCLCLPYLHSVSPSGTWFVGTNRVTKVHWYQMKAYLVRNLFMPGSSFESVALVLKMAIKHILFIFIFINNFGKKLTSFILSETWKYHLASYHIIWYLKWKVIISRKQNKCQKQNPYNILYFITLLVILPEKTISAW